MKTLILYSLLWVSFWGYSQVGVNTTEPHAQLDIRSSSQSNPSNTDGLLIPKIDNFPAVNPGTDQNGMMVFLTTTVGSNTPGFYYWEAVGDTWIPIKGSDGGTLNQAYNFGGAGAGNTIIADAGAVTIVGTDGLVSTGTSGSGALAPDGAGVRMVWNPRKSAFRAGRVLGAQWDDANIGFYSTAFGVSTTASGFYSNAFGEATTASGTSSTAFGSVSTASGTSSTAFGRGSAATGNTSTAFGRGTTATGDNSTAFGRQNTASSYGETVIGIGATTYTPSTSGVNQFGTVNATDRLFVIGNAIDANTNAQVDVAERSDAIIVLKNGLTRLPSMDNDMIDAGDGKTVVIKEYLEERSSGTLDQAYDFGGAGVGNTIIADAGAVTISGTDGFVSTGAGGTGALAPDGAGTRMVWNPRKAAFRAGRVDGTQWDDNNIGFHSVAFTGSLASGEASFAFGIGAEARGISSIALGQGASAGSFTQEQAIAIGFGSESAGTRSISIGNNNIASNSSSIAIGNSNTSNGFASITMGANNLSTANFSIALGQRNISSSYGETVSGIGATTYTRSANGNTQFGTANATDRLFVIGNAIDTNNNNIVDDTERSDAMVVLKNGLIRLPSMDNAMIDAADGKTVVIKEYLQSSGWSTLGNTGLSAATNFIGTTSAVDVIFRRNNIRSGRLGVNNTSFGVDALSAAGTGIFNTAVGSASLQNFTNGSRNVAVGSVSLNANTTGDNNTALGVDALSFNETGNNNTAVGRRAMGNTGAVSSGSNNTALGYFAYSTGNFSNSTALGANTAITANNQIRLGNTAVTSIGGAVGFTNLSDRRFKKNIQYDAPGLAFIKKLRPATYQMDMEGMARFLGTPEESRDRNAERIRENTPETGFIAQEVEQAAREVGIVFSGVDVPQSSGDYYGLRYASFVVPLVKAVQEQQQIIETQKEEITQLQERYRLLLQRVERLEQD